MKANSHVVSGFGLAPAIITVWRSSGWSVYYSLFAYIKVKITRPNRVTWADMLFRREKRARSGLHTTIHHRSW